MCCDCVCPGDDSSKRNWYAFARNYNTIRCVNNTIWFGFFFVVHFFSHFVKFLFTSLVLFKCTIYCVLAFAHRKKNNSSNNDNLTFFVLFPRCSISHCTLFRVVITKKKLFLFTYLLCLYIFFSSCSAARSLFLCDLFETGKMCHFMWNTNKSASAYVHSYPATGVMTN